MDADKLLITEASESRCMSGYGYAGHAQGPPGRTQLAGMEERKEMEGQAALLLFRGGLVLIQGRLMVSNSTYRGSGSY